MSLASKREIGNLRFALLLNDLTCMLSKAGKRSICWSLFKHFGMTFLNQSVQKTDPRYCKLSFRA